MTPTLKILLASAAVALAAPAAALAQIYPYQGGYPSPTYGAQDPAGRTAYGQPDGAPRGDWYGGPRQQFGGFPEFRPAEAHIRQEIQEGLREDELDPEDARGLFAQLRRIQFHEQREFRAHGWRLPDDDREQIQTELDQLDHLVDQTREEQ